MDTDLTDDRNEWKNRTCCTNPTKWDMVNAMMSMKSLIEFYGN